ncbi:MAG: DUF563 domain-containing protein [Deltaproteobacteria bacterium]|nr:DUF563 domain-containing protein [Deltaproteobacteria bacterium]
MLFRSEQIVQKISHWKTLNASGDARNSNSVLQSIQQLLYHDKDSAKQLAYSLNKSGDFLGGYCIYSLLKPVFPDDIDISIGISATLADMGNHLEAEKALNSLLTQFSGFPESYHFAASYYFSVGKIEETIDSYQQLLSRFAGDPVCYQNCASAYLLHGDYPNAMRSLKSGLSLFPKTESIIQSKNLVGMVQALSTRDNAAFRRFAGIINEKSWHGIQDKALIRKIQNEVQWILALQTAIDAIQPESHIPNENMNLSLNTLENAIGTVALAMTKSFRLALEKSLDELLINCLNQPKSLFTQQNRNIFRKGLFGTWFTKFRLANGLLCNGHYVEAALRLLNLPPPCDGGLFANWLINFVKDVQMLIFLQNLLVAWDLTCAPPKQLSPNTKSEPDLTNASIHPFRIAQNNTQATISFYLQHLFGKGRFSSEITYENIPEKAPRTRFGIIKGEPRLHEYTDAVILKNHHGIYNNAHEFVPESAFYQHGAARLLPDSPLNPNNVVSALNSGFVTEAEPTLFCGYITDRRYGHFWVDNLSRMWLLGKQEWHGKYLFFNTPFASFASADALPSYVKQIFELSNIPLSKVVFASENTRYKKIIVPEPGTVIHSHAYAGHKDYFNAIARRALDKPVSDQAAEIIAHKKVYLARNGGISGANRLYFGEEFIQQALFDNGFAIVHPHTLSEVDKVHILNNVDTVVGPEGSAFYAILYCINKPNVHILEEQGDATILRLFPELMGIKPKIYKNVCLWAGTTTRWLPGLGTANRPTVVDVSEGLRCLKLAGLIPDAYQLSYDQEQINAEFEANRSIWLSQFSQQIKMAEHEISMNALLQQR